MSNWSSPVFGSQQGWPWLWKIFRAFGIPVYLHLFFVIFVGAEIIHALVGKFGGPLFALYTTGYLFVIFGIVLLHEFGHSLTARKLGGDAEKIILWPLGGLALCNAPHTPKAQGLVAAGGPLVNVIIFAIFFPLGWLIDGFIVWNPLAFPIDQHGWHWFAIIAYFSYLLFIFNLIPAFPLDGGQILRAILWKKWNFQKATLFVTTTGYVFSIILVILGLGLGMAEERGTGSSLLLVFLGVFTGISCYQERMLMKFREVSNDPWSYSFTPGKTVDEKKKQTGFWEKRKKRKAAMKLEKETAEKAQIRERVDILLAKVSSEGMTALTNEEKEFLKNASKNYGSD